MRLIHYTVGEDLTAEIETEQGASLRLQYRRADPARAEGLIEDGFVTETGQRLRRRGFDASDRESGVVWRHGDDIVMIAHLASAPADTAIEVAWRIEELDPAGERTLLRSGW
jgi:hypothetical protein